MEFSDTDILPRSLGVTRIGPGRSDLARCSKARYWFGCALQLLDAEERRSLENSNVTEQAWTLIEHLDLDDLPERARKRFLALSYNATRLRLGVGDARASDAVVRLIRAIAEQLEI